MALDNKNIIITPNVNQDLDSEITFIGSNTYLSLKIYPLNDGMLSFEGNSGQLLSITDNLDKNLFSVNDKSGMPSLEVNENGNVKIAQYTVVF